jgi:hypothetical protein
MNNYQHGLIKPYALTFSRRGIFFSKFLLHYAAGTGPAPFIPQNTGFLGTIVNIINLT